MIKKKKKFIKLELFDIKNGEELTNFYLKSDVILLTCVFEKFTEVSIIEFDINFLVLCKQTRLYLFMRPKGY